LKLVAESVNELVGPELGVLVITHYQRMLNYITPQHVHVMMQGKIVRSGGPELAQQLEEKGYEGIRRELGLDESAAAEEDQD
jgi:Fe-S cluster assembly ATP-binding protein